jgi:hypothetical protein
VDASFRSVALDRLLNTAPRLGVSTDVFGRWLTEQFPPSDKALVVSIYNNPNLSSQEKDANVATILANALKARPLQ